MRMRCVLTVCLAVAISSTGFAQDNFIVMPSAGYKIKSLDAGAGGEVPFTTLSMLLPPGEQFAANIAVRHDPTVVSLAEYAERTKKQFAELKFTVLKTQLTSNQFQAEVIGKIPGDPQGNDMHIAIRAIKAPNCIVIATAAALQSNWEKDKLKLLPVIDSLQPLK